MLKLGDYFEKLFSFSQRQIDQFAELSGDKNPLHINPEYAGKSSFGKPIVHGVLTISIFSQIIGMEFPGAGTIYLGQNLEFKRPVYPDQEYRAVLEVTEVIEGKHIASIQTRIYDTATGKLVLDGYAKVKNKDKITLA
ncbi:MAG: MaoC family dehydratase [Bacteroidetes bacterium]|nr:MaoC family dehydratase [Bacteroidota bacterium]MDA1119002.1 MaoC family dehydratase [Bacteroidota bacterium]